MRTLLLLSGLLLTTTVSAAPTSLTHSGRLLDSTGLALSGPHDITFSLYDAPAGGSEIWSETQTLDLEGGYFSAVIGDDITLEDLDRDDIYVEISVDGAASPGRQPLTAVPYARIAESAQSVHGGVVNASEIQIDGQTVISSDGAIQGTVSFSDLQDVPEDLTDGDADSLSELDACVSGQVVQWDGTDWVCGDLDGRDIQADQITSGTLDASRLPIGDGDGEVAAGNHTHATTAITSGTFTVDRLPVGNGADQVSAGDHGHAASGITSGTLSLDRLPVGDGSDQVASGVHDHAASAIVSGTLSPDRLPIGRDDGEVAPGIHTHAGSEIVSGTVGFARLPVGTSSTTVSRGDHGHSAGDIGSGTLDADRLPDALASSVKIGADSGSCDNNKAGYLRLNGSELEICQAGSWEPLALQSDTLERQCPSDMVNMGAYCIDKNQNSARNWQQHANLCVSEGKRMCSLSEWIGACNNRSGTQIAEMLNGQFEYVDDYWVMNYTNGNYYSAYVSVGNSSCGRIYYSGWACANSSCYDTTSAGGNYRSRCCK